MPLIAKHGIYCLERFDAPLDVDLAIAINKLCHGFGDHYKTYFGPDFMERMTNQRGGAIICIAYIEDKNYASIRMIRKVSQLFIMYLHIVVIDDKVYLKCWLK